MDPRVFNAALIATARIACCSGILGLAACDEKPEAEDTATSQTADSDSDTQGDDWEGPQTADTGDPASYTDDDGDGYSEIYYDCDDENADVNPGASDPALDCGYGECQEHIADVFSVAEPTTTALTLDCCIMVTDVLGFDLLAEYDYRNQCCDLIVENDHFSAACTPWGPPTPPRMPEKMRAAVA